MQSLVRTFAPSHIPQTEPLTADQIQNSAGGYVWEVSDIQKLKRFLILGTEGGTFYITERKLTKDNVKVVFKLIKEGRGQEVLDIIKEFSAENKVKKLDYLLFVLAICARNDNLDVKRGAYNLLNNIVKIPTHLFMFIEYCKILSDGSGWGRAHTRAIRDWYLSKQGLHLATLITKYQKRNGWSHRDVLRLSHTKPNKDFQKLIFKYIVKGTITSDDLIEETDLEIYEFLNAVEQVKSVDNENNLLELIQKYRLQREHIPTTWLNSVKVWKYLLQNMGITALIRNLGKMTSIGLFTNLLTVNVVCDKLKTAKVHPLNLLLALKTYSSGQGFKGSLKWNPIQSIINNLDQAFYNSFKVVEPTGKSFMLALDVSGSMTQNIQNTNINCIEASIALSMITASVEKNCYIYGFSNNFIPLDISPRRRLDDNLKIVNGMNFGKTDCALPMVYALKNKLEIDTFIVYTDNETWFGHIHPYQALKDYRRIMNMPNAKLIVVGMVANNFTIANPNDAGMLDVVGFDPSIPEIINSFVLEEF